MPSIELVYFQPSEFVRGGRAWWNDYDPRLLGLLEAWRHLYGKRIQISQHPSACGRRLGPLAQSDHNVDVHGRVLGVDTMPEGITTRAEAERAIELARAVGFTGIGFYPLWAPSAGVHVSTRRNRRPGDPATWGAIRLAPNEPQTYVSLEEALSRMPE